MSRIFQTLIFQLCVGHHIVNGTHLVHALCIVLFGEKEYFARKLLPDLPRQKRRTVARVERADSRIGLLKLAVFFGGYGQVRDHVQGMPAARSPPGDQSDNDLGHGTNQALHLQNMQPPGTCRVNRFGGVAAGVVVAVAPADALVAARAERPPAIFGGGAVPGQKYSAYIRGHAGMIERPVEFVHSMRAKGVTHLGSVKSNAHGRQVAQDFARLVALHLAVVGDVGKILKPFNDAPALRVENIGNLGRERNSHAPYFTQYEPAHAPDPRGYFRPP